ncbi:MAG: hypothetical protein F4110_13990 [Acidimicrobiaceae bacterium]|nr:hypothetical protein [Acidimicrobiaceae bacterium]MXZ99619.1 hypothetical protein [Acidimicrobiaceae bacterium]MYH42754.1 hypothetical protein [Acidimicrobiaceae bacterium]MYI55069.1 hypothetical protein [Acidimicrobiaceae bacterium]MYJ41853.1 hypothetical protein [Acidimicrobiaceae bacterium]
MEIVMRCRIFLSAMAVAALVGGLVSATPAAATDGSDLGVLGEPLEDSSPDDTSTSRGGDLPDGEGSMPGDSDSSGLVDEPLEGDGSSSNGPENGESNRAEDPAAISADESGDSYGSVEEPTFDTMWEPGSVGALAGVGSA